MVTQCPSLPLDQALLSGNCVRSNYVVANIRVTVTVSTRIQLMKKQYTAINTFSQLYTFSVIKLTVKYNWFFLKTKSRLSQSAFWPTPFHTLFSFDTPIRPYSGRNIGMLLPSSVDCASLSFSYRVLLIVKALNWRFTTRAKPLFRSMKKNWDILVSEMFNLLLIVVMQQVWHCGTVLVRCLYCDWSDVSPLWLVRHVAEVGWQPALPVWPASPHLWGDGQLPDPLVL